MSSVIRGSDNFDSAAKSGTIEATASGALANGDMIVLNSDGTVSAVSGTSGSIGSPTVFQSAQIEDSSACYDTANNKVVVAYRNRDNGYGYVVVGTVSGSSISFGTPVQFETGSTYYVDCCYDSNSGKVVIVYRDSGNSSRGTAIVGTVSGTSISFGSHVIFDTSNCSHMRCCFDETNNKVVIAYRNGSLSDYTYAIVGTVSGTSISFGSRVLVISVAAPSLSCCFDSANEKIVIADGNGYFVVGAVSGTSISFGSAAREFGIYGTEVDLVYDSVNNKILYSSNSYIIVGTVSGTSFVAEYYDTWPSSLGVSMSTNSKGRYLVFDTLNGKANAVIDGTQFDELTLVTIDLSSSLPAISKTVSTGNIASYTTACFDPDTTSVIATYKDELNSNYATGRVFKLTNTNLTTKNFIGISDGAYTDTETATVQIVGSVDDAQSGLTVGEPYYVQADGTLDTAPDSMEVFAGTAISSTQLIIKG